MSPRKERLQALADIVKKARGSMSYREFEEKTGGRYKGVTHSHIRRLELCEISEPEHKTLIRLAPVLGFEASELCDFIYENSFRNVLTNLETMEAKLKQMPLEDVVKINFITAEIIAKHFEKKDKVVPSDCMHVE